MKTLPILTKDEVKELAPVAFADKPTRDVSGKYVFVSTEQILDDMIALGWQPTSAEQRVQRGDKPSIFSPHMLKFSNPDVVVKGKDGDLTFPQVIIQNRHDGLGTFKFMAGLYRLVCSNGLVIATAELESLKIAHKGYDFEELRKVVSARVETLPGQVEVMNRMKATDLKVGQKRKLALDAMLLRSGIMPSSEEAKAFEHTPDELKAILEPTRSEDAGEDLWSVYNVIQEKMTQGGWTRSATGRTVRKINSFERDLDFNKKLFNQASSLIMS